MTYQIGHNNYMLISNYIEKRFNIISNDKVTEKKYIAKNLHK